MWFVILVLSATVSVTAAGIPLPRKVVLNADNLEILRLDIMAMEVRVSNNFKEQSDRVVATLDRHGAKLDASGADLRRANVAMAAARGPGPTSCSDGPYRGGDEPTHKCHSFPN